MHMDFMEAYKTAKADLLRSMNVPEEWWYCAIEDHTEMVWREEYSELYWGQEDTEEYSSECRSIVFSGDLLSCVAVKSDTSSEVYFMVLDNINEQD